MTPSSSFDHEELLAHLPWVRNLALQIARDTDRADDLAQDALLVALLADERPRSWRAWLNAVVRQLGIGARRSEERRTRREEAVQQPRFEESTLDLIERASSQQLLFDIVLELEEPWRSTILMRFFEELSPRDISHRTGTPASTVTTRTAEGLQRLRSKLDRGEDGASGQWLAALTPLLATETSTTVPATAASKLMAALLGLHAKAVLAGVLLLLGVWSVQSNPTAAPLTASQVEATAGDVKLAPLLEAFVEHVREPLVVSQDSVSPSMPEGHPPISTLSNGLNALGIGSPPTRAVRGRVIDLSGTGVAGITVGRMPLFGMRANGSARDVNGSVTTSADGLFQMEASPAERLVVVSEEYSTVSSGVIRLDEQADPTIVVARKIPFAGRIIDDEGQSVVGASVAIHAPRVELPREGRATLASEKLQPKGITDESGRFVLVDAAEVPGALFEVRAAGFLTYSRSVPIGGAAGMHILLSRGDRGRYTITGRVLRPNRDPAQGALVSIGIVATKADTQGRFVLDLELTMFRTNRELPLELVAIAPGHRAATHILSSVNDAEESGWPEGIELVLGGPPLTISGRVVDQNGQGLPGVTVDVLDQREFGLVEGSRLGWGQQRSVEQLAGGGEVMTGSDGSFELMGLEDRAYRIDVLQRPSLLSTISEPIPAGSSMARIVADQSLIGSMQGRVVDRDGKGIEGVRVAPTKRQRDGFAIGLMVKTDKLGRFSLQNVTTRPDCLRLEGDAIVPELIRELPALADLNDLNLVVAVRAYLQVDWGDWQGRAEDLIILDAQGEELPIVNVSGGGIGLARPLQIDAGLSSVVTIPARAAHAVLRKGSAEVQRYPLSPTPGEIEILRL
ncbi:MAG: RNA polymerase sigma-70 factor (ECF subfamily) [Planctomycetota bacterium]|jgi:RNA polymerase sigma-70 factor (ECF subfamily)